MNSLAPPSRSNEGQPAPNPPNLTRATRVVNADPTPAVVVGSVITIPESISHPTNAVKVAPVHQKVPVEIIAEFQQTDCQAAQHWTDAMDLLPEVGQKFDGFELIEQLGQGGFGRVFLARQSELANRTVVLKIGSELFNESQTLAQLQHTNIVPIYSLHQVGDLQAVCMPFFGSTTLSDVLFELRSKKSIPAHGSDICSSHRKPVTRLKRNEHPNEPPGLLSEGQAPEAPTPEAVSRLAEVTYVEAVLVMIRDLANGLAHAHGRGVFHHDLKPANILLADDSTPLLLDFNLSTDAARRTNAAAAVIGGTLPYMAPEQLLAFRNRTAAYDERSDIYSLGLILYELLTLQSPFPWRSGGSEALGSMVEDRRRGVETPPHILNPAVTPAISSIVAQCLAVNVVDRYQKAEHLAEDLARQLEDQPLRFAADPSWNERFRKWKKRNPRLTSSATVASVAAVFLLLLGSLLWLSRERLRGFEAAQQFDAHREQFLDTRLLFDDRNQVGAMLAQGVERCRESLQRYGIPEDQFEPNWLQGKQVRYLPEEKQKLLRQDVGELFYLLARASRERSEGEIDPLKAQEQLRKAKNWNSLASNYSEKQLTVSLSTQKAELERLMKNESKAKSSLPIDLSSATLRDRYLLGYDLTREKQYREAIPHLEWVTRNDPSDFSAWFVRGSAHHELGQFDLAASCFSSALVLRSDFAPVWVNRGRSFAALKHLDAALLDLDQAVQLDPKLSEAYLQRAAIRQARRELKEAEIDLSRAIELNRETPVRLFFVRSRLRKQLNDARGAAEDLEQALARTPQDELSWVARGEHLLAKEPQAALTACDEAMKLNHRCVPALQLKVHLLSERLNRTLEAIMLLDRAVEWYPDHVPFRAGRGVLLARVGQRDRALADAEESLLRDTQPSNLYQVGCIYALTAKETPEDRFKAMELIGKALRAQFGRNLIERDSDLDPIRKTPEFKKLVELSR